MTSLNIYNKNISVISIIHGKYSDSIPNLIRESGIYPAYHMNKQHWISVDIEGYEEIEELKMLVDMSYRLVGHK